MTTYSNSHQESTPLVPRFPSTDSLILSVTAQKNQHPPQPSTLKNQFKNHETEYEIELLNNKLDHLEHQIRDIQILEIQRNNSKYNENTDTSNLLAQHQKNREGLLIGKFHKRKSIKANPLSQVASIYNNQTSSNITMKNTRSFSHDSRFNSINKSEGSKNIEMKKLRKEMMRLTRQMEKKEQSISRYSEKLSYSKESVKNLQRSNKTNEKLITKLVKQLKKSENIRKKQKDMISKQKQEIQELRNLVGILKENIKI